jgi:hypothetical protein
MFSRRWDPKKRIVPVFQPQPGRTHRRQVLGETEGTITTNNWSGGSLKGQWASCLGFWQVPKVSQPRGRRAVGSPPPGSASTAPMAPRPTTTSCKPALSRPLMRPATPPMSHGSNGSRRAREP